MDIVSPSVKEDDDEGKSLILIHHNLRGLSSKIDEFTNMLALEQINPQVICFSEHHMLESNLNLLHINNYDLSTGFCHETYKKGCVCIYIYIYIREDICYKSLDLTRICKEKIMRYAPYK
jgi:hypothetical protein